MAPVCSNSGSFGKRMNNLAKCSDSFFCTPPFPRITTDGIILGSICTRRAGYDCRVFLRTFRCDGIGKRMKAKSVCPTTWRRQQRLAKEPLFGLASSRYCSRAIYGGNSDSVFGLGRRSVRKTALNNKQQHRESCNWRRQRQDIWTDTNVVGPVCRNLSTQE